MDNLEYPAEKRMSDRISVAIRIGHVYSPLDGRSPPPRAERISESIDQASPARASPNTSITKTMTAS